MTKDQQPERKAMLTHDPALEILDLEAPLATGLSYEAWQTLLSQVVAYVKQHMSQYDGSHDWNHIERVLALAMLIYDSEAPEATVPYQKHLVVLAALLHDVGDRKYLAPGQDPSTMVSSLLTDARVACPHELAAAVQDIVSHVSYSNEQRYPESVMACLRRHPELAIVQDADRLDAIGAIGIGRCFTFSATQAALKSAQPGMSSMDDSIQHFSDKLVRLEGMMKTATGTHLAKQRTERIKLFQVWWAEETSTRNLPL